MINPSWVTRDFAHGILLDLFSTGFSSGFLLYLFTASSRDGLQQPSLPCNVLSFGAIASSFPLYSARSGPLEVGSASSARTIAAKALAPGPRQSQLFSIEKADISIENRSNRTSRRLETRRSPGPPGPKSSVIKGRILIFCRQNLHSCTKLTWPLGAFFPMKLSSRKNIAFFGDHLVAPKSSFFNTRIFIFS